MTGLLVLPNPHARGLAGWCWGRWGAFRFLVRVLVVVVVNVAVAATNRCNGFRTAGMVAA